MHKPPVFVYYIYVMYSGQASSTQAALTTRAGKTNKTYAHTFLRQSQPKNIISAGIEQNTVPDCHTSFRAESFASFGGYVMRKIMHAFMRWKIPKLNSSDINALRASAGAALFVVYMLCVVV